MAFPAFSQQIAIVVITVIFGTIFLISVFWRLAATRKSGDTKMKGYDVVDIICGIILVASSLLLAGSYSNYVPADSPACQVKPVQYGVVTYGVDITGFTEDSYSYPANNYSNAVIAYTKSASGFKTGYFAWDGKIIRILTSKANNLATSTAPGNWWVFADLNNVLIS